MSVLTLLKETITQLFNSSRIPHSYGSFETVWLQDLKTFVNYVEKSKVVLFENGATSSSQIEKIAI